MKKQAYLLIPFLLLIGCAPQKKRLYSWGHYDGASYYYLKNNDEKSTKLLMDSYKEIIEKQTGLRGVVPPGIYADYGFLLIQQKQTQEGKSMLKKEVELYPESKVFIDRILKTLN